MMRNLFPNHILRHAVTDPAHEVPILPELTAPQLPLDLWEAFLKVHAVAA